LLAFVVAERGRSKKPSTSDVRRVMVAAFRRPAGRFSPIFSNLSLNARPPFFDLALQHQTHI